MKSKSLIAVYAAMSTLIFFGRPARGIGGMDVNVGVNIGPPPPVVIPAPPSVIVIPGTYVYYAPDVQVDILFFHGYWYRPYQGHWYRATVYNGPWVYIEPHRIPAPLVHLPPNYRYVPTSHQPIPYGQLKKNWRTWENQRHWDHHGRNMGYSEGKRHGKHQAN